MPKKAAHGVPRNVCIAPVVRAYRNGFVSAVERN